MELLNQKNNFTQINNDISMGRVAVVDDFFTENTAEELRERMVYGWVYDNYFKGGYKAKNYDTSDSITNQLAKELKEKLPVLAEFQRAWSFIYNNKSSGVNFHADPSNVNLNCWVTPNESVNNFLLNGLLICNKKPPENWTRKEWNQNKDGIVDKFIEENEVDIVDVKYKYNRAIFFDGACFHKTNNVDMKLGLNNRRVSYTMLFGRTLE